VKIIPAPLQFRFSTYTQSGKNTGSAPTSRHAHKPSLQSGVKFTGHGFPCVVVVLKKEKSLPMKADFTEYWNKNEP
jgi:hypothetical protein